MSLPKVHPRTFLVKKAGSDLRAAILAVVEQHDLTYLELIKLLHEEEATWIKYALRDERHPDNPDRPADVE